MTVAQLEVPTTLTFDGKEYNVADFSPTIQNLVGIHTQWQNDLNAERRAAAKTEAAIKQLDMEISQLLLNALAPVEPELVPDESFESDTKTTGKAE